MTIVVLGPNKPFWGARVVQIPLLQGLRDRYPRSRLHLFSPVEGAEEFRRWGLADEVRSYRRGGNPVDWWALLADVRRARPDRLLNLRRKSTGSCLVAAAAPGKRVGYEEGALSRLLDERIPYDSHIYMSSRYLSLAADGVRGDRDSRSIPLFRSWMESRRQRGAPAPPRVLLFPGAGNPEKKWPLDRFLGVARPLAEMTGCEVALVLGPGESEERERLSASLVRTDGTVVVPRGAFGNDVAVEVVDSPSLEGLLALVESSPLTLANDCGPSHLVQLSGRRFLGLYRAGWSTLEDWFLDKENSDLLVAPETGGLESISIEAVLAAAGAVFRRPDCADTFTRFSRRELSIPRARGC